MERIMKKVMFGLLLGILALLAACSSMAAPQAPAVWTLAELDNVLDLAELGALAPVGDGTIMIGGKRLPLQLRDEFRNVAYGRTFNFLSLDDSVINALPIPMRDFFLDASPDELRDALAQIGVSVADIRRLQNLNPNGNITWQAFRTSVYSVAEKAGKLDLFNVSRLNSRENADPAPLAPLATYDITGKTVVNSYPFDCGPSSGSFRIISTSSTTSNVSSYYLAAKTSLTVGGVLRSDPYHKEAFGPISGVSDAYTYRHPCQTPGSSTSASGWHKGKNTSSSTAITKYSSW